MATINGELEALIQNEQLRLADKNFDCDKPVEDKQKQLENSNEQLNQCRELNRLGPPKKAAIHITIHKNTKACRNDDWRNAQCCTIHQSNKWKQGQCKETKNGRTCSRALW